MEKGFDVLLEAIHQLRTIEDIKVVIVGKGDEKARLQQYAAEHGLKAYIVEEMQDIEIIYTIADIVVIPSRQETVGLVAIEAAFFKKPVVASNVGGLKETIMDQVTGLAVEPEDPLAISAAIRLLYSKRDLASKLGCRLFEEVQSVYESNKIVDEMERIYSLSSV